MLEPADLVARAGTLATIPAVYLRLTEAAADPGGSRVEISRIVEQDAALSARLLHLVNSAAYAGSEPVDDVPRAVARLGLDEIQDLALATTVIRAFGDQMPGRVNPRELWLHGAACGVASRLIARRSGRAADPLFTAGVLHDVGRLVLLMLEPRLTRRALLEAQRDRAPLSEVERRVFGFDHATLGATLLEHWGLPGTLTATAGYHHHPSAAPRHADLAAVVHLADAMVHVLGLGASGESLVPPVEPAAWELVGLTSPDLELLVEEVERQYVDLVQVLLFYEGTANPAT